MPAVEVMVPQGRKVETLELGAEHVVILRHGGGEDGIWGQEHFWGACRGRLQVRPDMPSFSRLSQTVLKEVLVSIGYQPQGWRTAKS